MPRGWYQEEDYNKCYIDLNRPLSGISSDIYGPIGAKFGRKVKDRCAKHLRLVVSMATFPLPWQPKKTTFYGQIRIAVGYNIAYDVRDVMDDVT